MDQITPYWNEFYSYMRAGLADVNYLQVVVIALLGAMAASSFVGVIVAAALSVVIHVLVNALVPVLLDHKDFVPPAFDNAFMHFAASLFILYLVAIGVLFLIKMAVQHRPAPRVVTRHH